MLDVLTTRELASLILIAAVALLLALIPSVRRQLRSSAGDLFRSVFNTTMLRVYMVVAGAAIVSTGLARSVGLWDMSLFKDFIILTATVVFPLAYRSFKAASGGHLATSILKETFGFSVLLTFYLDAAPLPLVGELLLQVVALVLIVASVVAARQGKDSSGIWAARVLSLIGVFLFVWTTVSFVIQPPDWSAVMQSLFYGFWLPLSLFPFFYWFGYSVTLQDLTTRISIRGKELTRRNVVGLLIGSRGRLSIIQGFRPRHDEFVRDGTLRASLLGMKEVRVDMRRAMQAEADRLAALERNIGRNERDTDGRHLDRREYRETKEHLESLWGLQNGQYENRGSRYWDDVPDVVVDAQAHGLPAHHGVHTETSAESQVWRAWRRTPGGGVLGIGGTEHRSKFVFQGDAPPSSWPGEGDEWVEGFSRKRWPPDWKQSDDPIR